MWKKSPHPTKTPICKPTTSLDTSKSILEMQQKAFCSKRNPLGSDTKVHRGHYRTDRMRQSSSPAGSIQCTILENDFQVCEM